MIRARGYDILVVYISSVASIGVRNQEGLDTSNVVIVVHARVLNFHTVYNIVFVALAQRTYGYSMSIVTFNIVDQEILDPSSSAIHRDTVIVIVNVTVQYLNIGAIGYIVTVSVLGLFSALQTRSIDHDFHSVEYCARTGIHGHVLRRRVGYRNGIYAAGTT